MTKQHAGQPLQYDVCKGELGKGESVCVFSCRSVKEVGMCPKELKRLLLRTEQVCEQSRDQADEVRRHHPKGPQDQASSSPIEFCSSLAPPLF